MKTGKHYKLFLLLIFILLGSKGNAQNASLGFRFDTLTTNYEGVTGGSSRTFEFWIQVLTSSNIDQIHLGTQIALGGWGRSGNGKNHFYVHIKDSNRIYLDVNDSTTIISKKTFNDIKWHHVAFVYDSGKSKQYLLYVDGKLDTSVAGVTLNTGKGRNFILGKNYSSKYYIILDFVRLDEVRVFNYARNDSMIKADMGREFCSPQAGLQLYYKFNDGVPFGYNVKVPYTKDHSGFDRHGDLSAFIKHGGSSNFTPSFIIKGGSSRDTLFVIKCDTMVSPSGKYKWTKTGNYRDTIANFYGCDSLLLIRLRIGSSIDTIDLNACDSFVSPKNSVYKSSGIYKETYNSYTNCDSIVYYKVNMLQSKSRLVKVSSCDSFVSPSGKKYEKSGVYTEHFLTYYGCDSAITYDIKILEQSISFEIINVCDSVFVRGKWYKQNATPRFVFKNFLGCDSTHTVVIRMQYSRSNTVNIIACDSFITPNKSIIRKDSTHTETYRTIHGCDSVVTYKIKVQKTVQRSLNMKACRRAIINGQTYSNSGMVNLKLKTYLGCDSLVAINLNVVKINRGIERKHGVLTSMQADAKYTWIQCFNKQAIPFQTDSTFKVKYDDYYAVVIEYEGCKDTSICYHFLATSIDETSAESLNVFPQPNQGDFTIKFEDAESGTLFIHDLSGRLISEQTFEANIEWQVHQQLSKGVYVLTIVNGDKVTKQKLLIN